MKKEQIKKMIEIALSQLAYSYTPYSDFKVGAALLGTHPSGSAIPEDRSLAQRPPKPTAMRRLSFPGNPPSCRSTYTR